MPTTPDLPQHSTFSAGCLRAIENDALLESSFRRLLSAIETERDQIRSTWQQLQEEHESTTTELEQLRQDTEDWCYGERQKIDSEWKRLDKLSERMNDIWPKEVDILSINCRNHFFDVPRGTLCGIEGSYLSRLFSENGSKELPKDSGGRIYLDINPHCFGLVVEYLQNRRLRIDAPLPVVPQTQQLNMELLAEGWQLKPFLRENRVNLVHNTSLKVHGKKIRSTHPGWQVISSQHPLPMGTHSYFEAKVTNNPDTRGGLAIGVCGHIPTGLEIHTIRLQSSVLYISNNGLIGDAVAPEEAANVEKGVQLLKGSTMGVRHDVDAHALQWFYNQKHIGTSALKPECLEALRTMYPVFALYVPEQTLEVEFRSASQAAELTDGSAS